MIAIRKLAVFLVLAGLVTFSFSGCWDRRELDDVALVSAMGVDREGEGLRVTLEIIKPREVRGPAAGMGGSSPEKAVWVTSAIAPTIGDAVDKALRHTGRIPSFHHTRIILIGEELAAQGMPLFVDYIQRDPQIRDLTEVLLARGRAIDLLKAKHDLENIPSNAMDSLIKANADRTAARLQLYKLLADLETPGKAPVVPALRVVESQGEEEKPVKRFALAGAAVFRRQKLVGWLDEAATRGFWWVQGKVKEGTVVIPSPSRDDRWITLRIKGSRVKVKPPTTPGDLRYSISVKVDAEVTEVTGDLNLLDLPTIRRIERGLASAVGKEIQGTVSKAQSLQADIFGFGDLLRRKSPAAWREMAGRWEEAFSRAEVQVEVQPRLREVGLISESPR